MLLSYAKFMREECAFVIISTLVLGILIGMVTAFPGNVIRRFGTFVIVIMIGAMGFTITFKSHGAAAKDWKGFSFGLVLNFFFAQPFSADFPAYPG